MLEALFQKNFSKYSDFFLVMNLYKFSENICEIMTPFLLIFIRRNWTSFRFFSELSEQETNLKLRLIMRNNIFQAKVQKDFRTISKGTRKSVI